MHEILKQKAHARLKALNLSQTIDSQRKDQIQEVLKAEYMSSDESDADSVPTNDTGRESSGSEDDASEQIVKCKKKLIRRKLPWRS